MISELWKFINENILNNIFTITLLLLGVVLLIVAVSVGPKLLQKEKKTKRGAIERKVDNAFQKVDNEIGESIVEDYKEDEDKEEDEEKEEGSSVRTRRKSSVVNYKENPEVESLVGIKAENGKEDNSNKSKAENSNDDIKDIKDIKDNGKDDKDIGPLGPLNALGQNVVKAPLGGLNNIVKGNGSPGGEENLTSSSKESEKNGLGKKKRSSRKK